MVYLDNAATTRVCPEAAEAAVHMMTECFGNPSTTYKLGREAKAAVADLDGGGVLRLGNVRFHKGEEKNDPAKIAEAIIAAADAPQIPVAPPANSAESLSCRNSRALATVTMITASMMRTSSAKGSGPSSASCPAVIRAPTSTMPNRSAVTSHRRSSRVTLKRVTTNQQLVGRLAMERLGQGVSGTLMRGDELDAEREPRKSS